MVFRICVVIFLVLFACFEVEHWRAVLQARQKEDEEKAKRFELALGQTAQLKELKQQNLSKVKKQDQKLSIDQFIIQEESLNYNPESSEAQTPNKKKELLEETKKDDGILASTQYNLQQIVEMNNYEDKS